MTKKDYCFLIDTSFDTIGEQFADNVFFIYPEIIRSLNGKIESFKDGIDISREEVIKSLNEKYDLKTSQVPYGLIESKVIELLNNYEHVYIILITKDFSGMFKTCLDISASLESIYGKNRIHVIDSKSISMFQNILMKTIDEMQKQKLSIKEIDKFVKKYHEKIYAFTVITNANQLIKGGRLTGLKALLVRAFNIKLLIEYANGKLTYLNKAKDVKKALDLGIESMFKFLDLNNNEIEEICIYSDLSDDENQIYKKYIEEKFMNKYPNEFKIKKLPTIIITHLGDKSISLLCKVK